MLAISLQQFQKHEVVREFAEVVFAYLLQHFQ